LLWIKIAQLRMILLCKTSKTQRKLKRMLSYMEISLSKFTFNRLIIRTHFLEISYLAFSVHWPGRGDLRSECRCHRHSSTICCYPLCVCTRYIPVVFTKRSCWFILNSYWNLLALLSVCFAHYLHISNSEESTFKLFSKWPVCETTVLL